MIRIDEKKLENDSTYRFEYLADFLEFGEQDVAAIRGHADALANEIETIVTAFYEKLFSYDATRRHFVLRQSGYDGDVPDGADAVTLDHPQMTFRMKHLADYFPESDPP